MSQKNETLTLVLAFVITAGIIGAGFWWFTRDSEVNLEKLSETSTNNTQNQQQQQQPPTAETTNTAFAPPTNVPSGTTINVGGSTSMVQINQALKNSFEQQFPGTTVVTQAKGTDKGIEALQAGNIDIAGISRPLTSQEEAQGLVAVPVAQDAIAIVVGDNHSFRRGLTDEQVVDIFQGQITNWSALSGEDQTIRVLNRPPFSGTHQAFKELVLNGGDFGTTPNIETLERDATTPLLRALGTDGITYATYAQVANQRTVRTVAVNGLTPEAENYPYQRTLYYAYKQPANPAVEAFLGYVGSPKGQQVVTFGNG